jgi:hypothetical protein
MVDSTQYIDKNDNTSLQGKSTRNLGNKICMDELTYTSTNWQWHIHDSSYMSVNTDNPFKVYHQNIRGLKDKSNELISFLFPELPHVLRLIEHHLKDYEIDKISIDHYNLGAEFCR